jgi:hypothetical protein
METVDVEKFREYTAREKPVEFAIEYCYRKPLKACTLPELINAIILNIKFQNSADAVDYTDHGDYYTLTLTHSLGINYAKLLTIMNESAFKNYGVKCESHYSERGVFFKIYKN